MSLYNMMFGKNANSAELLKLLDADEGDFGRFRDVYVEGDYIVVHTRCGGGNREDYFPEWVEDHPWYSHDGDCDFDNTYADIYFTIPDDMHRTYVALLDQGMSPESAWEKLGIIK